MLYPPATAIVLLGRAVRLSKILPLEMGRSETKLVQYSYAATRLSIQLQKSLEINLIKWTIRLMNIFR